MAIKPDYQAGTASVAVGGTTVTFAGGANITAATIAAGDTFKVQNLDAVIASVTDSTHLELAEPWSGTALVAAPYRIRFQPDGSRYSAAVKDLVDTLGNGNVLALAGLTGALDEIPIFTGAGSMTLVSKQELTQGIDVDVKVETLAERAGYDGQAAGYSVLVADVGDGRSAVYFKVSNTLADWSDPAYLTGPSGSFQSLGNWSGATAYQVGDVVYYQGSSWIALIDHTNHTPPSLPTTANTWWTILSAAGSGFVFRGDYSGATAYLKDDVVINQGSSWIALLATTGNAPPTLPTTSNTQWKALAVKGNGDVSGPATNADGNLALWNGANSKTLKDGGVVSAYAKTLFDDADAGAAQTTLGISAFIKALLDDTDGGTALASLGVTKNLSAIGYYRFPSGLFIQWGQTFNAATDFAASFPVAFPTACAAVVFNVNFNTTTSTSIQANTSNVSTTSFDVRMRTVSNGGTVVGQANVPLYWIALGY